MGGRAMTTCMDIGYKHIAVPIRGDQAKTDMHLPMIHITFPTSRLGCKGHIMASAFANPYRNSLFTVFR